jgi:hypothetical protein
MTAADVASENHAEELASTTSRLLIIELLPRDESLGLVPNDDSAARVDDVPPGFRGRDRNQSLAWHVFVHQAATSLQTLCQLPLD